MMWDDNRLQTSITSSGVAGAVCIIGDKESTQFAKAYGKRDIECGAPMEVDSIFQIASMTKAVTSVAALQLVEQGKLHLDVPIGSLLPDLASPLVLDGFDTGGLAILREARTEITLRHLLTHTSGLGYDFMSADLLKAHRQQHDYEPGTKASMSGPLLFEPGERWEYGTSTDWVGLAVEAASGMSLGDYFAAHIFEPLGMNDTSFWQDNHGRLATLYGRDAGVSLKPLPIFIGGGAAAEYQSGGGGLFSTAPDYLRFLQMILQGGSLNGVRILAAESIHRLSTNQIGDIVAGRTSSTMLEWAYPYDSFPGMDCGWSLGFLLNREPSPNGRSAGSMAWAGIANCYYWADPTNNIIGIFLTQLLPFADPRILEATAELERLAYHRD